MDLLTRIVTDLDDDLVVLARTTLERALPPELSDDRFSDDWVHEVRGSTDPYVAAVASHDGEPLGYLGGSLADGCLRLEAVVTFQAHHDEGEVLDELIDLVADRARAHGLRCLEIWARPAWPFHCEVAERRELPEIRRLRQLRCVLPTPDEHRPPFDVETRAFVPQVDAEALRRLNNRAFAGHPDQGGLSAEVFTDRLGESWVRPEGIRLLEIDGELAGFCWTKIHDNPAVGEIYAIGVDPAHHGKGLGRPMTAAGLDWLAAQGLRTGMLYVEHDNAPAIRTYERLGFTPHRTDRAWQLLL